MAPRLFGETPRRTRHHFWRNGIAGRRRHRNVLALFGPLVRCEHRKRVRFMVPRCSMYRIFTYIYHKLYDICIPILDPIGYIDYKYKHVLYLHCMLYFAIILSHVIILIKTSTYSWEVKHFSNTIRKPLPKCFLTLLSFSHNHHHLPTG